MKCRFMRIVFFCLNILLLVTFCSCSNKSEKQANRSVRVKVAKIGSVQVNGEQGYSGTVEESDGVSISFSTTGTVRSINVSEGQMVGSGQLLATLDGADQSSALASSKAVTQQAREALRQAQDTYNRSKRLHEGGVISDSKWVEAQTALSEAQQALKSTEALEKISSKSSSDTRLKAPFSGYVALKAADVGQNVVAGEMILKLVKIDQVKVKISVPEEEISHIVKGENMLITCDAMSGATFYGRVIEKGVAADPLSRTYEVKLLVDNPAHKLLPGMICNVYTSFRRGQMSVFVPAMVVQLNPDNRMFVWIVKNGKATKRFINFVADTSQGVRVSGGLEPGDLLIVEGQQMVSEGTPCTIIK